MATKKLLGSELTALVNQALKEISILSLPAEDQQYLTFSSVMELIESKLTAQRLILDPNDHRAIETDLVAKLLDHAQDNLPEIKDET